MKNSMQKGFPFLQKSSPERQRGFSLIEILLYMAILGPIFIVGTDLLVSAGEFSLEAGSKNIVQEEGRFIMDRLTYEIHQVSSVNNPAVIGAADDTLNITVPVFFSTENREYSWDGTNLIYTRLIASSPSANLNSNHTKLNSFTVTRLGTDSAKPTIKINFELEALKKPIQGAVKQTFETVVGTR